MKHGIWSTIVREAKIVAKEEPALLSFIHATVINQRGLKESLAFHLARKSQGPAITAVSYNQMFLDTVNSDAGGSSRSQRARQQLLIYLQSLPSGLAITRGALPIRIDLPLSGATTSLSLKRTGIPALLGKKKCPNFFGHKKGIFVTLEVEKIEDLLVFFGSFTSFGRFFFILFPNLRFEAAGYGTG